MNDMTRIETPAIASPPHRSFAARNRVALMLAVPLLIACGLLVYWLSGGTSVSTDNAQVNANVVAVAPQVSGPVIDVRVTENQAVKAGDILYRIDPAPYRIALMQADAAVGAARLGVAQLQGTYGSKMADIGSKASDVALAETNFARQQALLKQGFATRASFDAANAALQAARAQRAVALSDAQAARAIIGTDAGGGHPQVEAAIALRDKAALDLARTTVRAPMTGTISQSTKLNPGQMAIQMMSNVSVVGSDYWIDANFKETQLAKIRVGQKAEIGFDAVPGRRFKAHVTGIGSGTGAQFSLLPAQNATGNWVKVTQRVPVRLKLDEAVDRPLVAGWSAHVTVNVG